MGDRSDAPCADHLYTASRNAASVRSHSACELERTPAAAANFVGDGVWQRFGIELTDRYHCLHGEQRDVHIDIYFGNKRYAYGHAGHGQHIFRMDRRPVELHWNEHLHHRHDGGDFGSRNVCPEFDIGSQRSAKVAGIGFVRLSMG
jgi:hypothetical protein